MKSKIKKRKELAELMEKERSKGKTIVFTNGCFDLLHVGHVRYLSEAKKRGDILVIGLNSDSSVRAIKGNKRPVISQNQRAEVLSALFFVDYISVFDEPDPLNLIMTIKPDILVKGADWPEDKIIGGDFVKSRGGKTERIPLVPMASTTGIIEKIIALYS